MRTPRTRLSNQGFIHVVDVIDHLSAKFLDVSIMILLVLAAARFSYELYQSSTNIGSKDWLGKDLLLLLSDLLTLLIALEVLQNVLSLLKKHAIQMELVLATALTAVARKFIVMNPESEDKPFLLLGLGIGIAGLSLAYYAVRWSHGRHAADPKR